VGTVLDVLNNHSASSQRSNSPRRARGHNTMIILNIINYAHNNSQIVQNLPLKTATPQPSNFLTFSAYNDENLCFIFKIHKLSVKL
jgi:hypothetical protein